MPGADAGDVGCPRISCDGCFETETRDGFERSVSDEVHSVPESVVEEVPPLGQVSNSAGGERSVSVGLSKCSGEVPETAEVCTAEDHDRGTKRQEACNSLRLYLRESITMECLCDRGLGAQLLVLRETRLH